MAWGAMAEQQQQRSLSAELQELFLVALGAVPGALLRWQVALHWADRHLLVNVLGAALLGYLAGSKELEIKAFEVQIKAQKVQQEAQEAAVDAHLKMEELKLEREQNRAVAIGAT